MNNNQDQFVKAMMRMQFMQMLQFQQQQQQQQQQNLITNRMLEMQMQAMQANAQILQVLVADRTSSTQAACLPAANKNITLAITENGNSNDGKDEPLNTYTTPMQAIMAPGPSSGINIVEITPTHVEPTPPPMLMEPVANEWSAQSEEEKAEKLTTAELAAAAALKRRAGSAPDSHVPVTRSMKKKLPESE